MALDLSAKTPSGNYRFWAAKHCPAPRSEKKDQSCQKKKKVKISNGSSAKAISNSRPTLRDSSYKAMKFVKPF